jgi:hypothetical protein
MSFGLVFSQEYFRVANVTMKYKEYKDPIDIAINHNIPNTKGITIAQKTTNIINPSISIIPRFTWLSSFVQPCREFGLDLNQPDCKWQ